VPTEKLSWPLPVFVIIIDVDAVDPGSTLLIEGLDRDREASWTCPRFTLRSDSQPTLLPSLPWM
jgi:hypothetical protein